MIPVDPTHKVPRSVIARVHKELKRREIKIQGEIISIMPLLTSVNTLYVQALIAD